MAVTNIAQGGNKTVQVLGLKELQSNVKMLVGRMVGDEAARVMGDAAEIVREKAEANARAVNLPHEAMLDFYTYERQPRSAGKMAAVTALAGLRKKGRKRAHGYVQWRANRQVSAGREKTNYARRKRKSLRVLGTLIGENLATMREFGTSKMQARPFFRPAIREARAQVLGVIADGYRQIIARNAAK